MASLMTSCVLILLSLSPLAICSQILSNPSKHFVLVHGAWQGAWSWYRVIPLLERLGHTVTAVNLAAHGPDTTPIANLSSNAAVAAPVLKAVLSSPKPVILVGHSYGGTVISTVAEKIPDKVERLVYVAAFLLPNNVSMFQQLAASPPTLLLINTFLIPPSGVPSYIGVNSTFQAAIFFNRCSAENIVLGASLYRPEPAAPLTFPVLVSKSRWGSIPRYYIYTDVDQAVSPALQSLMVKNVGVTASYSIPGSDHTVQLSYPSELVSRLQTIISK